MSQPRIAILGSLGAAWKWWTREITALVPSAWRRRLAGNGGGLVLLLSTEGTGRLLALSGGRSQELATLALDEDKLETSRALLASVMSRLPGANRAVVLRLPPDAALRSTMALPLAAEANLAQVVSFELDRRTPFKSDEIYFTHRLLKRDTATQRLTVELTVVPRSIVDEAMALMRQLDLTAAALEVAGAEPGAAPSGDLLPREARPVAAAWPRFAVAALATSAVLLAAGAVFIPLYRAHGLAETLANELRTAKQQADESLRLQKEIEAAVQESGFLIGRKRQSRPVSDILLALTHVLPDDTWLTELQISNAEVQLSGLSSSASTIIGLIAQTPSFANASFRSPVVQDQRSHREQFNISAKVVAEGPR